MIDRGYQFDHIFFSTLTHAPHLFDAATPSLSTLSLATLSTLIIKNTTLSTTTLKSKCCYVE
jgi:hypothetical protein